MTVIDVTQAPYSAVGDGVTDNTTAIAAAFAALPTSGATQGGVIYFPAGRYVTSTQNVDGQGVTIRGDGHGQWMSVSKPPTQILVKQDCIGFDVNTPGLTAPAEMFGGVNFERISISPIWAQTTGALTLAASGTVTLNTTNRPTNAGFPSTGTLTIQDNGAIGTFTYSAKVSTNQFTIGAVLNETSPGHSYASASIVALRAVAGVRMSQVSNWSAAHLSVSHFIDPQTQSTSVNGAVSVAPTSCGIINDGKPTGSGAGSISQYGQPLNTWVSACATGVYENRTSTRWIHLNIDTSQNSGSTIAAATTGYQAVNAREGLSFAQCGFIGANNLVKVDGAGKIGSFTMSDCRFEGWITDALFLDNSLGASLHGCSFSNAIGSNVGNAIHIGSGVTNSTFMPGGIVSCVNEFVFDTGANTAANKNVWIVDGVFHSPVTSYTPQTWQDNNPAYPVTAARLNYIEQGITASNP